MKPLHAPDPMGSAANHAALAALRLDFHLLAAGSAKLSREDRAQHVEKALRIWFPLVRAMSELERVAPNAAERARLEDHKVRDFVEMGNG